MNFTGGVVVVAVNRKHRKFDVDVGIFPVGYGVVGAFEVFRWIADEFHVNRPAEIK